MSGRWGDDISDIEMDGDRGPIDCELLTVVREYRISWDRDSEISAELARLRWEKKMDRSADSRSYGPIL